jgi:tetratricopeptide (TPR) repeat protein
MNSSTPEIDAALLADPGLADAVEELTARLKAGGPEDLDGWLAARPEQAGELRRLVPMLRLLVEMSRAGDVSVPPAQGEGAVTGTLGDFCLIREVGRGGMGVVYEAEQVSLGRRVALKVLPFAATMDPRQLQRFHNEARAAAGLNHTNIVPVYAVGCERGVHYYAMQFIEGKSLAEMIAGRGTASRERQLSRPDVEPDTEAVGAAPTEAVPREAVHIRRLAGWGIQAAEALEHAHALGIVHRDVKPANLIVDGAGKLWVTDFGLARTASDAGLTMSGDVLGTLRYMSPEQALARHGLVDHRTDIYSLGATLYELLTGRPAAEGRDRQEILSRVADDGPPPPRLLNRAVPAELETIVLKALEKDPQDRYATAQELADDLRRFVEDRPIRARRTPVRIRLSRWARRHRALIAAAAALLLTALVLGGVALGWRLKQRDEARRAAADHLRQAEGLAGQSRWGEALEALGRADERLAGEDGSPLKEQAVRLRDDIAWAAELDEARSQAIAIRRGGYDEPGVDRAYQDAFGKRGRNPLTDAPEQTAAYARASSIRGPLVAALDHWSFLRRDGRDGTADRLRAAAALADDDPWRQRVRDPAVRADRAAVERLAAADEAATQPTANLLLLVAALKDVGGEAAAEQLLRRAQNWRPNDFWVNLTLADVLTPDNDRTPARSVEAVGFCRAALARRPGSAAAYNALGNAWFAQREYAEAEAAYREAVALQPDSAIAHANLGAALTDLGRLDEGEGACRRAIALQPDLALAHDNLSTALREQHKLAEAERASRQAVALLPTSAVFHYNLGAVLADQNRRPEAIEEYQRSIGLRPYSLVCGKLGIALQRQGELDKAVAAYRQAIALQPDAYVPYCNLGGIYRQQRHFDLAVAAYRKAAELQPNNARAHANLANTLRDQGKLAEAVAAFQKAIALQPDDLQAQARYSAACAAALAGCGPAGEADRRGQKERARFRSQALQWLRADLAAYGWLLERDPDQAGPLVRERMRHWQQDSDFAGVRGPEALAELPEAERQDWQELWQDVEALRKRGAGTARPVAPQP